MKKVIFGMYIISTMLSLSSCSSTEDDPTANLPVCDCVELEPQRDENGKRINGREHIMYLKDSLYTGKCVTYHLDNTTKKVELIFQKGLLNGSQQAWDEKGNKILEAPMSQGQFHGTLKEWDEEQHLISKMEFDGNKLYGHGYYSYFDGKDKKMGYKIFLKYEPVDVGYYYPTFFQNYEDEYGNKGYGRELSTSMNNFIYIEGYGLSTKKYKIYYNLGYWEKPSGDEQKKFVDILNEFHTNNPNVILSIEEYSNGRGSIDATPSFGLNFSNGESNLFPVSDVFVDYCNNVLKPLSFLKFHTNLDKHFEESKIELNKKSNNKSDNEFDLY